MPHFIQTGFATEDLVADTQMQMRKADRRILPLIIFQNKGSRLMKVEQTALLMFILFNVLRSRVYGTVNWKEETAVQSQVLNRSFLARA